MNFSADSMSSAMSPFLSGTSSPVPGNYGNKQVSNGAGPNQMPSHLAMAAASSSRPTTDYSSPALAYANAQLSQYASHQSPSQQPRQSANTIFNTNQIPGSYASFFSQGTALPAHLNPHALSAALADYSNNSVPNSAASSPGQQYKRLAASSSLSGLASGTATGASTPGGNSRVAASAITGKRLNWSEMICQTIAESESGRLVIQDLFEGMCNKFPEIREWAFGKDWEGRVKNRIKSTLSIKGNLFIKVPRPTSASGKGSWWTLSQEAQDAWKEGRVASVVKSGTHSRSMSQTRGIEGMTSMSAGTSRAGSRAPSRRGSPVSNRGPSSHHANQQNPHPNNRGTPQQSYVNFGQDTSNSPGKNSNNSNRHSPNSNTNFPVGLGMSPINFGGNSFDALSMSSLAGMDDMDDHNAEPSERRMRMMENSVNDSFDAASMSSGGGGGGGGADGSSNASLPMNLGMTSIPGTSGSSNTNSTSIYDISPYNSFSTSAAARHLGPLQSAAHLGGPQSMPFPAGGNPGNGSNNNNLSFSPRQYTKEGMPQQGDAARAPFDTASFLGDPSFAQFGGMDLSSLEGMNNPFGSMAGGYTMLSEANNNGNGGNFNNMNASAQPTPIPGRNTQMNPGMSGSNSTMNQLSGSNSSFSANFIGGPSPADSTGSTSAFFAYTPAMMAADTAMGSTNNQGSALGPIGGEGSRKKKEAAVSDFQLPPSAQNRQ